MFIISPMEMKWEKNREHKKDDTKLQSIKKLKCDYQLFRYLNLLAEPESKKNPDITYKNIIIIS